MAVMDAIRRRAFLKGLAVTGAVGALGARSGRAEMPREELAGPSGKVSVNVREAGVVGDGQTHVADRLQAILDAVHDRGGGMVHFPSGCYILDKTLFIPSRVHLVGEGSATIFKGHRPGNVNGFALIANAGITDKPEYDGARDFSLQNVAIDSPRTNGIVLVHARDGYFSNIYGVDAFHHHFDMAGCKNIITENLFLTGRSGTAPYQIDGTRFNNNIWDGERNVPPYYDDTPNDGIFLTNSVIHPTNRPVSGIHLHRDGGQNMFIDNVIVEHCQRGIHRDPNTHRKDVFFSNVVIKDMSREAILFQQTRRADEQVTFTNIHIEDVRGDHLISYQGGRSLTLQNVRALADEETGAGRVALEDVERVKVQGLEVYGAGTGTALSLNRCRQAFLGQVLARNVEQALSLAETQGVRYSGLVQTDADDNEVDPVIAGADELAAWSQS